MLEDDLKGATSINLNRIAEKYFTPEFLETEAETLLNAAARVGRLAKGMGIPVVRQITEKEKAVAYYCARELLGDLWNLAQPTFRQFISENGRFNLDAAIEKGLIAKPTQDIKNNLEMGRDFLLGMTDQIHRNWLESLEKSNQENPHDKKAIMYKIYRAFSVLNNAGDWDLPTVLESTFLAAARENFDWTRDFPDMSRAELEEIVANSMGEHIDLAGQTSIKSGAKEEVVRTVAEKGELAYVLDPKTKSIVFNPRLRDAVARTEQVLEPGWHDKTKLVLQCPAKFVPSSLYSRGNLLKDILDFKFSVYVELYLATHNRR